MTPEQIKPGVRVRHYKGGLYEILCTAHDEGEYDPEFPDVSLCVVYGDGTHNWIRPLIGCMNAFCGEASPGVERFTLVSDGSENKGHYPFPMTTDPFVEPEQRTKENVVTEAPFACTLAQWLEHGPGILKWRTVARLELLDIEPTVKVNGYGNNYYSWHGQRERLKEILSYSELESWSYTREEMIASLSINAIQWAKGKNYFEKEEADAANS